MAKTDMSFSEWFQVLLDQRKLSVNKLAGLASVDQGLLNKVKLGKRYPTDELLDAVALHLGVPADELKARRDASDPEWGERLGRVVRHAPDALGDASSDLLAAKFTDMVRGALGHLARDLAGAADEHARGHSVRVFNTIVQAVELLSEDLPDQKRRAVAEAIEEVKLGAQVLGELPELRHPPTGKELQLLAQIGAFDRSELDPRSGSYLWVMPTEERWPALKNAERDWKEAHGVDKAATWEGEAK